MSANGKLIGRKRAISPSILENSASSRPTKLSTNDSTHKPVTSKRPRDETLTDERFPENAITHWPCHSCSCSQGVFDYPINACLRCEHNIDEHRASEQIWSSDCSYICLRQELIASILQLVRDEGLVVIRAMPQVGMSTLLLLLRNDILDKQRDLEPVLIHWIPEGKRDGLPYKTYLEHEKSKWEKENAKYRPRNPKARTIYLIDEAHGSYEEHLWTRIQKNRTRSQPLFVLGCLDGAADVYSMGGLNIEEMKRIIPTPNESDRPPALCVASAQRIELRPINSGCPYLLFKPEETAIVVKKWAITNEFTLDTGACEYIHAVTNGYPGIISILLAWFKDYVTCVRSLSYHYIYFNNIL